MSSSSGRLEAWGLDLRKARRFLPLIEQSSERIIFSYGWEQADGHSRGVGVMCSLVVGDQVVNCSVVDFESSQALECVGH